MTTTTGSTKSKVPPWSLEPFERLMEHIERLDQLLDLSIGGISLIRELPDLVDPVATTVDKYAGEGTLERTKKEAALADREVREGFPLLHAQATIAVWSSIESTVRLFLAQWLRNEKKAMDVDIVQKLKVRFGEYERLSDEDRSFFIVDRIEQEVVAPLTNGINRFEALLEPFGLSGKVKDEVRRDLFELSHVRNALVHRYGVADKRLAEGCPWLKLTVGDPLRVNHDQTRRYLRAAVQYNIELILRISEYFGDDVSEHRQRHA